MSTVNIGSIIATLGADIRDIKKSTKQAENSLKHYAKETDTQLDKTDKRWKESGNSIAKTAKFVGGVVASYFAVSTVRTFAEEIVNAGVRIESVTNAFKAVKGSGEAAQRELGFVSSTATELGLNLKALEDSYKTLAAASINTSLEGQGVRDVFRSVAEATSAMQLTATQSHSALYALTQMMSKGRVQTEELRRQLGEQLPGAFKIAAEAMGVTELELNKMLEQGKVVSEEFLPKFAEALHERFGEAAVKNAELARGAFNRFSNAVENFKRTMADAGVLEFFKELAEVGVVAMQRLGNEFKNNNEQIISVFETMKTEVDNFLSGLDLAALIKAISTIVTLLASVAKAIGTIFAMIPADFLLAIGVGITALINPVAGLAAGLAVLIPKIKDTYEGFKLWKEGHFQFSDLFGDSDKFEKMLSEYRKLEKVAEDGSGSMESLKAQLKLLREEYQKSLTTVTGYMGTLSKADIERSVSIKRNIDEVKAQIEAKKELIMLQKKEEQSWISLPDKIDDTTRALGMAKKHLNEFLDSIDEKDFEKFEEALDDINDKFAEATLSKYDLGVYYLDKEYDELKKTVGDSYKLNVWYYDQLEDLKKEELKRQKAATKAALEEEKKQLLAFLRTMSGLTEGALSVAEYEAEEFKRTHIEQYNFRKQLSALEGNERSLWQVKKIQDDKKAEEEITKNLEKELKERATEYENFVKEITGETSDFFYDLLENGTDAFDNLFDSAKKMFLRMLADMAAQAIAQPIIVPFIQSMVGGGGSTGSILSSFLGGGSGGGFDLGNILGLGKNISGLFGGATSGLYNTLTSGLIGDIGSGIFGGLWAGGATPISTGALAAGGELGWGAGALANIGTGTGMGGLAGGLATIAPWLAAGFAAFSVISSLFEDNPDPRVAITSGNFGPDNPYSDVTSTRQNVEGFWLAGLQDEIGDGGVFLSAIMDFVSAKLKAFDEMFEFSLVDVIKNSTVDTGTQFIRNMDLSTDEKLLGFLNNMTNAIFDDIRENLLNTAFGELSEDVMKGLDLDFFKSLSDSEDAFEGFLTFSAVLKEIDGGMSRLTDQMEDFGLSAEDAFQNLQTIVGVLNALDDNVSAIMNSSIREQLTEINETWDALIETLKEAHATTTELEKAEKARNLILGATLSGFTADNIQNALMSGTESLASMLRKSMASLMSAKFAEDLMKEFLGPMNEAIGKAMTEGDIDGAIALLLSFINDLEGGNSELANKYAELMNIIQDLLGVTDDASDAANDLIEYEKRLNEAREEGIKSIQNLINELLGSDLAPAGSMEFMNRRYQQMLAEAYSAMGTESFDDKVSNLTNYISDYLDYAQTFGGNYAALFNKVIQDLDTLSNTAVDADFDIDQDTESNEYYVTVKIGDKELEDFIVDVLSTNPNAQHWVKKVANS